MPLWSTAPAAFRPFETPGDHIGVLSSYPFRNFLWKLLAGADAPAYSVGLVGVAGVTISLNRRIYAPGEAMSVLLIPDQPTTEIAGTLTIEKATPDARAFEQTESLPLAYQGFSVTSIRAEAKAPAEPGLYRITLDGKTHSTAPQAAAIFAVSADRRPPAHG